MAGDAKVNAKNSGTRVELTPSAARSAADVENIRKLPKGARGPAEKMARRKRQNASVMDQVSRSVRGK